MSKSFPKDSEERRQLASLMHEVAPALMQEIVQLRQLFPGARLRYFKAGDIEVGEPSPDGYQIPEDIVLLRSSETEKAILREKEKAAERARIKRRAQIRSK